VCFSLSISISFAPFASWPLKTWIPAFAGMTGKSRNYDMVGNAHPTKNNKPYFSPRTLRLCGEHFFFAPFAFFAVKNQIATSLPFDKLRTNGV
jgi:hypothetical protein